jgi:hypothetical protein
MRSATVAIILAILASAHAASAAEPGGKKPRPTGPRPGNMVEIAPAGPIHGHVPDGYHRPLPDEVVTSPPMEPHFPDGVPGVSGGGNSGMTAPARPMPMPLHKPSQRPQFDHCQLLQAHFPDWRSDPRMKGYLTAYCFQHDLRGMPGKFVPKGK